MNERKQETMSAQSMIELSKLNYILNEMSAKRALLLEHETILKEVELSFCPLGRDCICARSTELSEQVCDGNFDACPAYSSLLNGHGYVEQLSSDYENNVSRRVA